ncbi:glycosyltransferase family 2 protein [Paracoccus luteus]|uniref:glycosyltransferase family 2 protein n=1 Tax=Paracoccus luteus TaxID=2508543 RepID=UPI0010700CFE|nr:glycosyltransferase family 2 protein [Paracoccus luteus]
MTVLHTIILNWRSADMTLDAAAAAVTAMHGIDGAITIVDNDSGDGSLERMAAAVAARAGQPGWDRIAVVPSGRNGGFGAGNNFAIRRGLPGGGRPELTYLLNSDAMPRPDAIRALIDHLDRHPEAGIACSRLQGPDGAPHSTAFRFPTAAGEFEAAARSGPVSRLLRRSIVAMPQPTETLRVDWSAGASMMIRQDVLDRIGLFDETFFLYFEETDLCRRAALAGWQTHYVVESLVVHIGSASTGMKEWSRVPDYWYDSRRHYFLKHHGRRGAVTATLAHLGGGALWRLRCALTRRPVDAPPDHLRRLVTHALRPNPRSRPE